MATTPKTPAESGAAAANPGAAPSSDTDTTPTATTPPAAPPAAGDVTTPPGGPKASDAVPGTTVGQLGYDTKMIDALLDERAGYVAGGRDERVKAVDKQLAAYGTTFAKATKERATRTQREASTDAGSEEKDRQRAKMIAALLDEREAYMNRGMTDRVAQVDESLKTLGTTHAKAAKERAERLKDRDAAPNVTSGQQTR